jgi:exopolysaccharide biosynthesis protein
MDRGRKKLFRYGTVLMFTIFAAMIWRQDAYALEQKKAEFALKSGKKQVIYVQFHPSENLMIRPAFAEGGIGSTSSLSDMAKRHQAVAAINGTFFNAYDPNDLHPMGAIMIDREYAHIRGGAVVMGITASGELEFSFNHYLRIEGTINGSSGSKWYASFINHMLTAPNEIVIFTPEYRERRLSYPGTVMIVVAGGVVQEVRRDAADIPNDGFVIVYGADKTKEAEKFHVGDTVAYRVDAPPVTDVAQHLISVGPKLLTDGKIDIDFERDGIRDPKMTSASAQRSFIGKKADGTIVMGTVGHVTIAELADLLQRMGLTDAMNLDGGASSGLFYNGKLLTQPGRQLSNSLVVVRQARTPRVQVNGEEQFFGNGRPYLEQKTTMVPVELLETIGATLSWSTDGKEVVVQRLYERVVLREGSKTVIVNGQEKSMPVPSAKKGGRLYVPLRIVSEAFGADVRWDAQSYLASVSSEIGTAERHYGAAMELRSGLYGLHRGSPEWQERAYEFAGHLILALRLDPGHEAARTQLSWLGFELDNDDTRCPPSTACLVLGWSAYRAGQMNEAIQAFEVALQVPSDEAQAHYGLGLVYRQPDTYDLAASEAHLRKVIELAPESEEAERARALLSTSANHSRFFTS